jgi:Holliday junction resolvase RusA-like endonuclease
VVKLTITGDVPSKKNSKQIIYVRGRPLIIPSKNHKDWHTQAISQLLAKRPAKRQIKGNIEIVELIFYPSNKRLFDLSNKAESILDLLVDAGVIEDDNYSIVPELNLKFGGQDKENPRAEVNIYNV